MKVLQIIDGKSFGDIARLISDVKKYISDEIAMDILTATNIQNQWYNLGISRETLKGRIIYNYRLFKFLKQKKYDIVHINSGVFLFSFQVVMVAKLAGVKIIIAHSHSTPYISKVKRILINILNPLYRKLINLKLTCSGIAAQSLFTKTNDVICLKNGIDIEKFRFNEDIRNEYRKKFNIEDKLVYGHVGSFETQKNHNFLIEIFYEIQKIQDNSVLLLVGNGKLKNAVLSKVKDLGIKNKVIFLNFRDDVNNIFNCMDVFIFPSISEGLGMVAIEAQTNGLITYCSEKIPVEANISSNFRYFKLNESSKSIAKKICKEKLELASRKYAYKNAIEQGYNIESVCEALTNMYKKLYKK